MYFGNSLNELVEYRELIDDIKHERGPVMVCGCLSSQKAHLIHEICSETPGDAARRRMVVTYSETEAKALYEDLRYFDKNVFFYPAKDLLFFNADVKGNELTAARIKVLREMLESPEWTVVTTIAACMEPLVGLEEWGEYRIDITSETRIPSTDEFARKLVALGYRRESTAEDPGQFAIRGGIIDIYPLCDEAPYRIELWGDEIDSIRFYDPSNQRSLDQVDEAHIYPATQEPGGQAIHPFPAYAGKGALLFVDEPARVGEMADAVREEYVQSLEQRAEKGLEVSSEKAPIDIWSYGALVEYMSTKKTVLLSGLSSSGEGFPVNKRFLLDVKGTGSYAGNTAQLFSDLSSWKKNGWRVVFLVASHTRAKRIADQLVDEQDLRAFYSEDPFAAVKPGEIMVLTGSLHKGFSYPAIRLAVIPDTDLFGKQQKKKRKKKYEGKHIGDFTKLEVGDYVVHENHGMGVYKGIEKIEVDHVEKDYIKVEYAAGGVLFLPVTQSDMLQRYSSGEGHKPRLNRLGGQEWTKTKNRVRAAVADIAEELIRLYAVRQATEGHKFSSDTEWQHEFEEMVPFELTADQETAITDTKADMESKRIMDRLICGDVGFGKTEVALRAAFKAVQDGKQVAILVPTTVLAQQHARTFINRLAPFAVNVMELSRFQTAAEQKTILKALEEGGVDIVVGTHRLLSKDVKFHDLGLLIVDEEQRFGVTHKEKIKGLKENVDTLTLTATPIPRTMHMSLIGIRDMSVLEEPPQDRVPIQTYVMEYHEELAREAIARELDRGGQVYYVYNRVKGIQEMTAKVQAMCPDARVEYAHGQMSERKLEQVMLDFINGEIDVLVSTTIIETGLDIPNVNTILIHDADRFGLSQLYQLKGRVGRSNRSAYAFLFYRVGKVLKEDAEKRLQAIRDFTELGSGVRIAMKDLEIRGAGNLLGAEQHGHMEAVGYDLYCKLLNEAILVLKGGEATSDFETAIDLPVDAFIPTKFIPSEAVKMEIYKRISGIVTEEDMFDVTDELIDRFGQIPKSVQNLLDIALTRGAAHRSYMTEVALRGRKLKMTMYPHALIDTMRIPELVNAYGGRLRFLPGPTPAFECMLTLAETKTPDETLRTAKELVLDIANALVG